MIYHATLKKQTHANLCMFFLWDVITCRSTVRSLNDLISFGNSEDILRQICDLMVSMLWLFPRLCNSFLSLLRYMFQFYFRLLISTYLLFFALLVHSFYSIYFHFLFYFHLYVSDYLCTYKCLGSLRYFCLFVSEKSVITKAAFIW